MPPSWVAFCFSSDFGAGGENRTHVTCLEGRYISHYTTPAEMILHVLYQKSVVYNSRIMRLSRLFGRGIKQAPAPVNAIAEAAQQSSADSFEKRRHLETNRQHVGRYTDSKVVAGHQMQVHVDRVERSQQSTRGESRSGYRRTSKLDIVKPSRQAYNTSYQPGLSRTTQNPPSRYHFTEPPSRYG